MTMSKEFKTIIDSDEAQIVHRSTVLGDLLAARGRVCQSTDTLFIYADGVLRSQPKPDIEYFTALDLEPKWEVSDLSLLELAYTLLDELPALSLYRPASWAQVLAATEVRIPDRDGPEYIDVYKYHYVDEDTEEPESQVWKTWRLR